MKKALHAALLAALLASGCSSQAGGLTESSLAGPPPVVEEQQPESPPAQTEPEPDREPEPEIAMDCPVDEDTQDGQRTFEHAIDAVEPYVVNIDYGDGESYDGTHDNLDAVFEHEYEVPGDFNVTATVTDANGKSETASCSFTWTALAEVPPYSEMGDSNYYGGCGYDEYENVDGECIARPGDGPSGASARCNDGTYSYSQNRRGTCSGHGGVAEWY